MRFDKADISDCFLGESQQVEAELWPQAVSSAIPDIIKMMDDVLVDSDKIAGRFLNFTSSSIVLPWRTL